MLAATLGLVLTPASVQAQGCTQCRDNVQAVPPRTQSAYRGAIGLLAATALTVVAAATFAVRRIR